MNEIFQKGMVIKLEENSDNKYVIIENLEKENNVYLLLTDLDEEINMETTDEQKINIDYSKTFMVSCNKETLELHLDSNKDMIRELVKKAMNK